MPGPDAQAIAFVGFMGAGKTTAAEAVARALGESFVDTDQAIEAAAGRSVAEIFEHDGEAAFREREERVVLEALERSGVVALGGGAVQSARVRDVLRQHVTVWCDVREGMVWERCADDSRRPLARDREEFSRRYRVRRPLYEEVARAVLPAANREAAAAAAPWLDGLRTHYALRLAWAHSASGDYPAAIGPGALELLAAAGESAAVTKLPRRWFCVADGAVLSHHSRRLPAVEATIEVEGGESSKTLAEAERVLHRLAQLGALRDDGVLAVGGGVIGDLAGFCAATYQRGIAAAQVPTTLLAQVDSAYGGKTGVDLAEAKNYVGAYHQPVAVLADTETLDTLPAPELAAGFAEVVKTALIAGGDLWDRVRQIDSLDPAELTDVIFACARTKLDVVSEDERDGGRRAVLNLGHTVGHAIEAATGYRRYRHGEAVALGLLAALRLSDATELDGEVRDLLDRHGLPTSLDPATDVGSVLAAVERDKKRTAEGIGFVLLERPGEPRVGQIVDPASVRSAVEELRAEGAEA